MPLYTVSEGKANHNYKGRAKSIKALGCICPCSYTLTLYTRTSFAPFLTRGRAVRRSQRVIAVGWFVCLSVCLSRQ